MWRTMDIEQETAWHNGYWSPNDVRETDNGVEYWDSAHMCVDTTQTQTQPNRNGDFIVRVYCGECGRVIETYLDTIM